MLSSRIGALRTLAAPLGVASMRTFMYSAVAFAKSSSREVDGIRSEKRKVLDLTAQLRKEKKVLRDLVKAHKETVKNHKKLNKERAAEDKAYRPVKHISGLNIFVKENAGNGARVDEIVPRWTSLSDSEKQLYAKKAEERNQQRIKLYTPKPKRPANAYSTFVRENWFDGDSFISVLKTLASQWKQLSKQEKESYGIKDDSMEKYKQALKAWREHRLKVFREHGPP